MAYGEDGHVGLFNQTYAADLHDALKEAFKQEVPVLLSVPVDYRENLKLSERLGNIACPI